MFAEHIIRYADVEATVAPKRGAIVTQLKIRDQEILFLDRPIFDDPARNVRGGIPILFPYSGKLINDQFVPAGTHMGQHGFARSKPWEITFKSEFEIRCALNSDDATMAVFPYEFQLEQTCLIVAKGLQIELQISNMSEKPMPVAPGWHPYFLCAADRKRAIEISIPGFQTSRFTNDTEFDFGIPAPRSGRTDFTLPEVGKLQLSWAPNMHLLQFWTLPLKKFVCIEPCTGPINLINTADTPMIQPGKTETYWMRVQYME